VSIEMPEATILALQMQVELVGKTVTGFELRDCENLQRMGFVNKDPEAFRQLVGQSVDSVASRGNTILVRFSGQQNLILSPEYGGEIFYHKKDGSLPARHHLRLDLSDGSAVTVRITTMGGIYASCDEGLPEHYMIQRDFDLDRPEPNDALLTLESFSELLGEANRQLKPVLVGKDAVVVGLSNSAFQDILYRAGLHPKRRASDLGAEERKALYEALRLVVEERFRHGGKAGFHDLHGDPGGYRPAMGPGMKGAECPVCGSPVQKLSLGGGDVFVCPGCQPENP
jgi:formamidopyrimidine-DNA glycosylase